MPCTRTQNPKPNHLVPTNVLNDMVAKAGLCVPPRKFFAIDNVWMLVAITEGHTTYAFYNEEIKTWCSAGGVVAGETVWGHTTAETSGLAFPDPACIPGTRFVVTWYGRLLPTARTLLARAHLTTPRTKSVVLSTWLGCPGRDILAALRSNAATGKQLPPFVEVAATGTFPAGPGPTVTRDPYTPEFADTLKTFGDEAISSIVVCRTPLSTMATLLSTLLINKKFAELNSKYDQMFHTFAMLRLANGKTLLLEKNATLVLKEVDNLEPGLRLGKSKAALDGCFGQPFFV